MNSTEQKQFVIELSNNITKKILENINTGKIPEDWDGTELRWLLADKFADAATYKNAGRKRKYNNTVINEDL
jgi:hypothetical protein